MADILDRFLRDPVVHSGCYDGIDWYMALKANGDTKLSQSKDFRTIMPALDVPKFSLRAMAYALMEKHAWKAPTRMRSDRVWSHVQRLKWYKDGADILRPGDYRIPKDEIWAVPPPETMGVFWGLKGNWGLGSYRGAKVLRIRVDWMDRFSRI